MNAHELHADYVRKSTEYRNIAGLHSYTPSQSAIHSMDLFTNRGNAAVKAYEAAKLPQDSYAVSPWGELLLGLNPYRQQRDLKTSGMIRVPFTDPQRLVDGYDGLIQLARYLCSTEHHFSLPNHLAFVSMPVAIPSQILNILNRAQNWHFTSSIVEGAYCQGGCGAEWITLPLETVPTLRGMLAEQGLVLTQSYVIATTDKAYSEDGSSGYALRVIPPSVDLNAEGEAVAAAFVEQYTEQLGIPLSREEVSLLLPPFWGKNVFYVLPVKDMDGFASDKESAVGRFQLRFMTDEGNEDFYRQAMQHSVSAYASGHPCKANVPGKTAGISPLIINEINKRV